MIVEVRDEVIQKRGYSESIAGDSLSLEISSYPITAKYLAGRLSKHGGTICELCCGIGISLLEFSRSFDQVIGVDSSPIVIENARNNLLGSGVTNCELIVADIDSSNILNKISADIVAYDIPYWSDHQGAVRQKNPNLKNVIEQIRSKLTRNIVIYAPPHMTQKDFTQIAEEFEYQEVWVDGKHDRNFIYLGTLIDNSAPARISLHSH